MRTMAEFSVQEIKEECQECGSTGRLYFNTDGEMVEYIQRKQEYFDQHLASIKQFFADGYIDCPMCKGKGYKIERR
jgi:ssDNA-binding Zn-finger/Zn-ribbon topoisomerase 1